jgi:hypothetical protein
MENPLRDEILKMQDGPTTLPICIILNNNILYSIFVISQKLLAIKRHTKIALEVA